MTLSDHDATFIHFSKRVKERIGEGVEPREFWNGIISAIERNDPQVKFVSRISRKGRRIWRVFVADRPFFVVFDHNLNLPITVLTAELGARCHPCLAGKIINLEDHT